MAFLDRDYGTTTWNGDKVRVVESVHVYEDGTEGKPFYVIYAENKAITLKGFNQKYLYLHNEETGKTVFLHRIIYACCTGLNLGLNGLEVHHIDFDTHNNRIENLVAMSVPDHRSYHTNMRNAEKTGKEEYLDKAEKILSKAKNLKENRINKWNNEEKEKILKELSEI